MCVMAKKTTYVTTMTPRDSREYLRLVAEFPLVSIQSERQFAAASAVIDGLLRIREEDLRPAQEAYLAALSDLVMVYENEHFPMPDVSGAEMLEFLMDARGVKQADIVRGTGIAKSTIAQILNGKRRISQSHLPKLAEFFRVPAGVFLPRLEGKNGRAAG